MDNKKANQEILKSVVNVNSHLANTEMVGVSNKTNIICLKSSVFMKVYELNTSMQNQKLIEFLCANLAQSRISYSSVENKILLSAFFDGADIEVAYDKFQDFEKKINVQNLDIRSLLENVSINFDKTNKKINAKELLITRGNFKTKILPAIKSENDGIMYDSANKKFVATLCFLQYSEKGTDFMPFLKSLKETEIQTALDIFRYSSDEWKMYCNYLAKRYNTKINADKQKVPITVGTSIVMKNKNREQLQECIEKIIDFGNEQNYVISPVFNRSKALYEDVGSLGLMPKCQRMRNTNMNVVKELLYGFDK